jgi:uncharacterized membrane protein YjfL (UPF0719 family)
MQYFTLIGGFIGFLLTLAVSIFAEKDLSTSVFNATIGCIVVAILFRGLRYTAEVCAKQIVEQKARLRDEALAAEQAASATENEISPAVTDQRADQAQTPA